ASCGIDIDNANGLDNGTNKITIKNCSQAGIWVNNCGPTISKVECDNASNTTYQNGGITVSGSSSNPSISYVTVKNTYFGMKIATSSTNAIADYCDIQNNNTSHSIQVNSSCLLDLHGASLEGNNNIVRKDGTVKAINNPSTGAIDAQNNWWGVNPPTDALFSFPANINYTNYKTSSVGSAGAGKRVLITSDSDEFKNAQRLEFEGNFTEALDIYKNIVTQEKDILTRKHIITSILRATDKYDRDYSDIRSIIIDEVKTAEGWYEASLDYIFCDLLFREVKYEDAIAAFLSRLYKYKGTSMEVEMFARIAEIYGDYLDNKTSAKEYAEKASAINPGQSVIRLAYDAAGEEYNPALYEDVFAGTIENFDVESEPIDKPVTEDTQQFVSISPNPANPVTTISYSITEASHVKLEVFNVSGQKVTTLVDGFMSAGSHSATFDGANLSSGVYLYNFESNGFRKNGKLLIVR
ncbi:MAG: T9SS type A sorting domain-containing protein, partial [Candidatus Latescibacteria bacterium]|nr:T9SS type A sorting domain-containing protein [Candidatus Latescibacterota bacterium]